MKRAVVSEYGRHFSQFLMERLLAEEPVEVVKPVNGPCNCYYEELDPDSYHLAGCQSCYATVRLHDGTEVIVSRVDITIIED